MKLYYVVVAYAVIVSKMFHSSSGIGRISAQLRCGFACLWKICQLAEFWVPGKYLVEGNYDH